MAAVKVNAKMLKKEEKVKKKVLMSSINGSFKNGEVTNLAGRPNADHSNTPSSSSNSNDSQGDGGGMDPSVDGREHPGNGNIGA